MGKQWYNEVNQECNDLAQANGLQLWQVAGILVTLSGQKDWDLNRQQARQVVEGKRVTGMVSNHQLNQCRAILSGQHPLTLWSKYSHKYRNFYACIMDPNCPHSVCVDSHMINWYLENHPNSALHGVNFNRIFESPRRYKTIQDFLRRQARALNLLPMQYQAIVWVERRGK